MGSTPVNPGGDFAQSGAGVPPGVNADLNPIITALKEYSETVRDSAKTISNSFSGIKTNLDDMSRSFDKWKIQLKSGIDLVDDYKDKFKNLTDLTKKFRDTNIFNARNFRELKAYLEAIKEEADSLSKTGFFNKKEQQDLNNSVSHLSKAIDDVNDSMGDLGE